jgi:hypothetical protein
MSPSRLCGFQVAVMNTKETLYKNINLGIIEERYPAFRRNLERNLVLIRGYGGLKSVIPFFRGKNVIVAGAGPSLEEAIPILNSVQGRADVEIISTDMALKPLLSNGVRPGYVISCETTPADFFSGEDTGKIHLLAFSCMSGINLRKWKGNISFFNWMIHTPEFNMLWEKAGTELGFLATGSIVTTQAVSFALGCSVNSLALTGNDLGFSRSYHSRGSITSLKNMHRADRLSVLTSREMNYVRQKREYEIKRGDKLFYTSSQFLAAKTWLEELFQKNNTPVYDCSEPGCSGKYVIKTDLKDFIEKIKPQKKKRGRRREK